VPFRPFLQATDRKRSVPNRRARAARLGISLSQKDQGGPKRAALT
jgi:hypothetical protein